MKVLHLPYGYFPEVSGGTEVYVHALALALKPQGIASLVVAPAAAPAAYHYETVPVRRFALPARPADLRELYGEGSRDGAAAFAAILDEERPDLVHFHALTRGVSLAMARAVKQRGLPLIFTYHTPTVSCQRGTLLRWGQSVCDGDLARRPCAACVLHGQGLPKPVARLVGGLPAAVGRGLGRAGLHGGFWTALRMRELVALRQASFHALMAEADQVVVLCRWVEELLRRNGVAGGKLILCRHGLPGSWPAGDPPPAWNPAEGPLRLLFLGRLDPTKGVDILAQAVRALPRAPLELHLYGLSQGSGGQVHRQALQRLADGDGRIQLRPAVPHSQVLPLLRQYHLLAVPSQWLETGPLVVLEAFAAGIPVLGSNLGGIAEWVQDGVNGLLVSPANAVAAWAAALQRLTGEPAFLSRLAAGVSPPRTMDDVGAAMASLYRQLLRQDNKACRQEPEPGFSPPASRCTH